ncbi:plastocyanin [Roseofilum casamattae]|uniref:Plastocyanin n=1 Tax=Roseofilum casamattae BLCC-M143 TaxID=3022442 RepID=A0ABT7BT14_9CYAN|nr:plastocyanin [Roseofilum casamattae]MDJ1182319.1 plastocyanin [Roseofilum casamattae BLCC-M143]
MKTLAKSLVCLALSLLLSVGINLAPAAAATVEVKMGADNGMLSFVPNTIEVSPGDTIKWVNNKLGPHNAMVDGLAGVSKKQLLFKAGDSYESAIPDDAAAGTYAFYCEPHRGAGMQGKLIVK